MDRHKSAVKRNRQNINRRKRNRSKKTHLRHQIREIFQALDAKETGAAAEKYRTFTSVVDKAARLGLIHKNAAARQKSRLLKRLQAESPAEV